MEKIKPIHQASDISIYGGKAYNLYKLSNLGFDIPEGICLPVTYWKQLTNNGKYKVNSVPSQIKNEINKWLIDFKCDFLIVRSSALCEDSQKMSYAGLFKSEFIKNNWEDIRKALVTVWDSGFSDRVKNYTKKVNANFPIPVCIIIQELIEADYSGVSFTISPNEINNILIESTVGLAKPLVNGEINPDRFVFNRKTFKLAEKTYNMKKVTLNIKNGKIFRLKNVKESLSTNLAKQVAQLSINIENSFLTPQDIEWVVKDNRLLIVQTRPITTSFENSFKASIKKGKIVLKGLGASIGEARGKVIIAKRTSCFNVLTDSILVAEMTDPNMVNELIKAKGIITDRGGMICHAAIISREIGIPCVVGTNNATKVLSNNSLVTIDGSQGIVWLEDMEDMNHQITEPSNDGYFNIFGQKVPIKKFTYVRSNPLIQEIWKFPWKPITKKEYTFIPPRPEITASPLTQSLVMPAIEQIPFILDLNKQPLVTILHKGVINIELGSLNKTLKIIDNRILTYDEDFFRLYMEKVKYDYTHIEEASDILMKRIGQTKSENELISNWFNWWEIHNEFFARTYLMQAIGDDIVWPKIQNILSKFWKVEKANHIVKSLLIPTKSSLSLEFLIEAKEIVDNLPLELKKLISSNIELSSLFKIIKRVPQAEEFNKSILVFTKKWSWMRDRDLYFPPLNSMENMLRFLRNNVISNNFTVPDLKVNKLIFKNIIKKIGQEKRFPRKLVSLIQFGIFLNFERNNHFYIWLKATDSIRKLFLRLGDIFVEERRINEPSDIFFLFALEIIDIVLSSKTIPGIDELIYSRKMCFCKANSIEPSEVNIFDKKLDPISYESSKGYW